jgi:hypothetical protein
MLNNLGVLMQKPLNRLVLLLAVAGTFFSTVAFAADLQVVSVKYYSAPQNNLSIVVSNNGDKVITAFSMDVTISGTTQPPRRLTQVIDTLPLVISKRYVSGDSNSWNGSIEPHTTYTETMSLGSLNMVGPPMTQVKVTSIVYSDGRATGSDAEVVQHIFADRTATLRAQELVLSIAANSVSEQNINLRLTHILDAIKDLQTNWKITYKPQIPGYNLEPLALKQAYESLSRIQSGSDPNGQFEAFTAKLTDRHARLAPYATMTMPFQLEQ